MCTLGKPWWKVTNDRPADEEASGDLIVLIHSPVQEGLLAA